jgi:hypothetical protein
MDNSDKALIQQIRDTRKKVECGMIKPPMSRQSILSASSTKQKPPKLRFRPGSFMREKGNNQLYCIRCAFRYLDNPSEWLFVLEYRNNIESPQTFMSFACAMISQAPVDQCVILWEPLRRGMYWSDHEFCQNMYHFDSSKLVYNKDLLNNYILVSSGEIQ